MVHFRVQVVILDVKAELNFFQKRYFLIFLCFFFFLRLFIHELVVVHYLADGRYSGRGYLNKVKPFGIRNSLRFFRRHDSELFAFVADDPYLGVSDLLVELLCVFLAYGRYTSDK